MTDDEFAGAIEDVFGCYPDDDGAAQMYIIYMHGDESRAIPQPTGSRTNADDNGGGDAYNAMIDFMYRFEFPVAAVERSGTVAYIKPTDPTSGFDWVNTTRIQSLIY